MEEQISNIKKETPELEEVINENNNIIKSQEKVENQSTCNLKDNTNIKISPFFNKNSNGNERKKNVHSLKLDKKKLKLHTNKKIKKNKKSNQNIFALSFFKNLNEKSNLDLSNNQNENSKKDEKSASEIVIPSKEKEDNISLSQSSQALNEENKNENKNDDNNSEENSISQLKNNIEIDSDSQKKYESQKCPICNMCLDFYTFKEREKHVNLCIDSSIRKENKKNLFNKKEDNKISFFYKNIKNTDNNEKIKDSNYSTNIQTEFITDTPNDIILDNSNISTLPSNNQFKCKICDEEACFSTITELYSHLFQCFSKIESDHFFFKEKLNFILNQNECFCCMKPWPEFEEKAAHIKECIAIKKNYMEKIENLMKYYLKQKKEKEKAFLEKNSKNSKYRHFKGSIYLKKKNPDSIPDKMKEIEGENKNSNTLTNTESIFNLNKYDHKNKAKENNDEKKTTVVDQNHSESKEEEKKVVVEEEEEEEDIEESYDTKCCFCNEDFENSEEELIVKHIEICIKEKMKFIEDTEDTKYKPRYIQKLTRCPCCSKKWLEYSMANLKEKLTHIFECSSKNGVSLARISIILNQCKSRFKEEEEKAKAKEDKKKKKKEEMEINDDNNNNNNNNNNKNNEDNSNSNSNSNSNDIKENKEKMEKFESKNDLNTINETSEEIKDSIRKRKVHNSQEENNIIVLNIEDESSEDFKSNSLTFRLSSNTSNNARSYRQRTLYDDIEEDQLKLAKALSKSLYQDENQKIRLKIMNTSTVLSVEDAHSYNFSRANSLFNLTQQKYSLWEMSMLNPEDILKAETVIEPLQKYSYDIRMTLKNEGIDEYISTITFPVPDRRLLKVSSIEGIDKYFNDQVNNRKLRLDKYKKLLTLQTSLWIKKMRKKQHSLKKELLTLNLENPEDIKNTRIFNDVKLELNEINNNNNNDNNNKSINSNNIDENDNIVNDIEDNNSLKIIDDSSDTYNDINNNIDDIKDNDSLEIIDDNNNDYNSFNNKIHDNKDNDESIFISQMNSNKNINNNDLNNDSSIDEIVDTNDTNDEFFNIDDDMIID